MTTGAITADKQKLPTLTTRRLVLRAYRDSDFDAVHAYGKDPEVSRHMKWGPNTEEMTRGFLRGAIDAAENPEEKGYSFAMVLKESSSLIGGCNISRISGDDREAMIGYTLNPNYWGRGFTTEAAAEMLRFGFQDLGLHRIISWCTPENIGSWRVMEKNGMRREGHAIEAAWIKGVWRDWLYYAILDREWAQEDPASAS